MLRRSIQTTGKILFSVMCLDITAHHIGYISILEGPSMNPTIATFGDFGIVSKSCFPLERGQLVVFDSPNNPKRKVMKRIIGLVFCFLFLTKPEDQIFRDASIGNTELVQVPKGYVWVEGDNAVLSLDSREYGPVPISLIQGSLIGKVYPLIALK